MSKKILVIDDDPTVLVSLDKLFRKHGYDVTTAQSGEEALTIIEKASFDLAIADIRMPGIDGVETAKAQSFLCNYLSLRNNQEN